MSVDSAVVGSPLRALYHRWQAAKARFNGLPEGGDSEAYETMRAMEVEVMGFEPLTMEDLWFKIIFADDDGDMTMNEAQQELAAMAYRELGITPRLNRRIAA